MFNPGYQVIHYEEGINLPDEGTYYVVAGNGLFLHKDLGIIKGFVPVSGVDFFVDLKPTLTWTGPKIPKNITSKIKKFFRKVFEYYGSEACVVLYLGKEWEVEVPRQYVSHASVFYRREALAHNGAIPVGTIHSHANFSAFHSSTDVDDEENFDGIHITFGHNDREQISISASIVMNGYRSLIEPESVLEDGNEEVDVTDWLEKVKHV